MAYRINSTCTRCGLCIQECPSGSILDWENQFIIDADTCADHGICAAICPEDAIVPVGNNPKIENPDHGLDK